MQAKLISIPIPAHTDRSARLLSDKGGKKIWSKPARSMLLILLLASSTIIALAGTSVVQRVTAQPTVAMWVTPSTQIYEKGNTFSITIWLNDTADPGGPYDVRSWALTLSFDPSVLDFVGATRGTYLSNFGLTYFVPASPHDYPVTLACIIISTGSAEGPGDLASVTFRVIDDGRTTIDLKDTELRDSSSAEIPLGEPVDGLFYTTYPRARFYYLPSTTAQGISGISTPFHLARDPLVNETVTFSATAYIIGGHIFGSYDPDTVTEEDPAGALTNYEWDFDDGNVTSGYFPTITHSFSTTGYYNVNLTVTDYEGKFASLSLGVYPVIHDVGVSGIKTIPAAVNPGESVSVNVMIENMGTISTNAYVNVTLFSRFNGLDTLIWYNETMHKSAFCTVFEIDPVSRNYPMFFLPGDTIAVNYTWFTTGLTEGDYILWANISLVDGTGTRFLKEVYLREMEFNVTNNLLFGGPVTLTETALPPVAYFTFVPFNPSVGSPVTFDATFSYDSDGEIISYQWDFGDGQNGTGMVVTHIYGETGTYFTTLTVTDQDNLHASMHAVIVVVPVVPEPLTKIHISPETSSVGVDETFTIDVRVQDVQNLVGFEFYLKWNASLLEFVRVSEGPFLNSSGAYQSFFVARYPGFSPWPYTDMLYVADTLIAPQLWSSASGSGFLAGITFKVLTHGSGVLDLRDSILLKYDIVLPTEIAHTDEDGYVAVLTGHPPVPTFTYSPSEPVVNQTISFDASASYDPDGTIIGYRWFFGDGKPVIDDTPFTTHTYSWAGNFSVGLTVTDNNGLYRSIAKLIIVRKPSSVISISALPINVKIGRSTTLSGAIVPSRPWTDLTILRRPQGAEDWGVLSFVSTNEYGEYSYEWYPYSLGAYELKAVWTGDYQYEGSESEVITLNVVMPQPVTTTYPAQGSPGTKVEVSGTDFPSRSFVYLTFDDQLVGFLYTDIQGNFNATFNLPLSSAGAHKIKAWTMFYYGQTNTISAETSFTVIDLATLDVNADVGTIFFKQETAEFHVQTILKGEAVNATSISAVLRKPDGSEVALTPQLIETGHYRILYLIAGRNSMTGTYTLVVEADYAAEMISAHGTTIKTFLVKPTWERELPRVAAFSAASIGLVFAMTLLWRKEKKKIL